MTYAAMDSYLRDGGKLGFVITQTVFKTKGGGEGFRRFRLGEDGAPLKVLSAQDLVELQPFEGASNRTATVVLQKGEPTEYPVSYTVWEKTKPGRIGVDFTLEEVEERTRKTSLLARPVASAQPASPWLTASPAALAAIQKAVGPSSYKARAGACTWANGVFWLRVLERQPDGLLLVENLHDAGKIKVKRVEALIEPDLVYPHLRGRDVSRWRAHPSAYILMVQDPAKPSVGFNETHLKVQYPLTYGYLKEFEELLRQRSGYRKYFDPQKAPFYSMYNVGEYTFTPYKVVWRQITDRMQAVSTKNLAHPQLGAKAQIPGHKLLLIPCKTESEADFVAGILNSQLVELFAKASMLTSGYSTSLLEHVAIPKFDPANALHNSLARLSQQAHQLATQGKEAEKALRQVEAEIDRLAAQLWGLTEEELEEIRRALRDSRL